MDLSYSPDEERFRAELRAWLENNRPGSEPEDVQEYVRYSKAWAQHLYAAGWAGLAWPKEYGGRGASLIQQIIYQEETARAKVPVPMNLAGITMAGPVLIARGTEEQKQRYLKNILTADEVWCQGF